MIFKLFSDREKKMFWLVIFPILFIYSIFKYSKVLFSSEYTLASSGDGLATISGIYALQDAINNGGWHYLFSDMMHFVNHGSALSAPGPFSQFWKIVSYSIGALFSPETTYEVVAMLGYFIALLVGYAFIRYLGASRLIALILCISLASMDNTIYRAQAHLFGLGVIFAPILVVFSTYNAMLKQNIKAYLLLASAHLLNLNMNEYYGFFGLFYTISFFLVFNIVEYNKVNWKSVFKSISISLIFFIILLFALYPNILASPFLEAIGLIKSNPLDVKTHVHDWNSFSIYTLKTMFPIFQSDIHLINQILDKKLFDSGIWEMTYRLGIVLPILICIFLYTILIKDYDAFKAVVKSLIPWVFSALFLLCFALAPSHKLSLVFITYELAPMFRVGLRSLLYFDIAMFAIFTITLVKLKALYSLDDKKYVNLVVSSLLILLALLIHNDVSKIDFFQKMPALDYTTSTTYKAVEKERNGILLEIPFYSPKGTAPESNYPYIQNRILHKKILANQIYYGSNNLEYVDALDRLSKKINSLNEKYLDVLIKSGVSYIAVSRKKYDVRNVFLKSNKLELISEDDKVSIFKVDSEISTFETDIRKFLNKLMG